VALVVELEVSILELAETAVMVILVVQLDLVRLMCRAVAGVAAQVEMVVQQRKMVQSLVEVEEMVDRV
jgi:hypothetical protein